MAGKANRIHVSDRIRKGRGSKGVSLSAISDNKLRAPYDLVSSACSESTKLNIKLASKVILEYAQVKGVPDPLQVIPSRSVFVLNLLADYCKFGKPDSLKNDAMNALVQGLRPVYSQHGHTRTWFVDESNAKAHENPLIGNPELDALRRAHRVHLAHYGVVTLRSQPITVEHICDHAERYWFGSGAVVSIEDILLHSILVVGLNLGLRYDEVSKMKVENTSVGSGGCTIIINESIKNSTKQRIYRLRNWDGNTALRFSVYLDPFVAMYSWLLIRGSSHGPLFCDVKENIKGVILDHTRHWSAKKFTEFLQKRLLSIGVSEGESRMYSGHSIKRGSVQLYRSLGLRDEAIMELIQLTGHHAYTNYCAAYNGCAPQSLSRFSSVSEYVKHAEKSSIESDIIHDQAAFEEFMEEVYELSDMSK